MRAAAEDAENAALYVRFMRKAADKGVEWVSTEVQRLTKMSEKPMSGWLLLSASGQAGLCSVWSCALLGRSSPLSSLSSYPGGLGPPQRCRSLVSSPPAPCCPARLALAAAKLDEVSRKISVLSSFLETPEEAAALAEAEDAEPIAAEVAGGDDDEEGEDVYADGFDDNEGAGG